MYYILVCLSKVFQRTIFSFVLPFQRESVCKGKAFCFNLQIFSKFFWKKISGRFSEGVRLTLSRSLAHPQGKILSAASGTLFHSPSFTQSVIFSGSPSRKRLQRYALFSFTQLLPHTFLQSFFRLFPNSLIHFMLWSIFFIIVRKRMWNNLHYIIRACAYVYARKEKGIILTETKGFSSTHSVFKKTQGHFAFQFKRKDVLVQTLVRLGWNARAFFHEQKQKEVYWE